MPTLRQYLTSLTNTYAYMVKDAINLLDLYKAEVGMDERDYTFVKDLLNTAFQEGILFQMQKDINRIKSISNEQDNIIQHFS